MDRADAISATHRRVHGGVPRRSRQIGPDSNAHMQRLIAAGVRPTIMALSRSSAPARDAQPGFALDASSALVRGAAARDAAEAVQTLRSSTSRQANRRRRPADRSRRRYRRDRAAARVRADLTSPRRPERGNSLSGPLSSERWNRRHRDRLNRCCRAVLVELGQRERQSAHDP